jgi:hypothetical protein
VTLYLIQLKRTVVYYKETKRELKKIIICKCRCNERLKAKAEGSIRIHWVVWGTGTPKDRDEVKRREVWECEGWVCDLETIGAPSMFKLICKSAALARMWPTFDLNCEENATRRKWYRRTSNNRNKGDNVRGKIMIVSAVLTYFVSGRLI